MVQLKNEVGNQYGRWTVLSRAENSKGGKACWLCQCECGSKDIVDGSSLRSGNSKSCGCLRAEVTSERMLIDLTGKRFGRWTVIERASNGNREQPRWLCRCDCGNKGIAHGTSLRDGNSQSCGCLARERTSETHLIDLTGKRFGRWTVVGRAENVIKMTMWLCHCDCGTERVVHGNALRSGNSQSCGCLQRELASKQHLIDETGNRYGRWLVLERAENAKQGKTRWLCRCDCGNEGMVMASDLRSGRSQSCGCLNREMITLPEGEAAFNKLIGSMKSNARDRGYEWALTKEQVRILTKQDCRYCGVEPRQVARGSGMNGDYIYNGLDRVDNDRGYEVGNVVPCCGVCNSAKRARTLDQFRVWSRNLYEHFGKGETE